MDKKPYTSRSEVVKKTVQILKAFSKDSYLIGVRELAERINLPRSTVQRLLSSLEDEGLVFQDPVSQRYGLGTGILVLAGVVLSHMNFRSIALPFMMGLSEKWQETIDLDVLEGADVIIVEQIPGQYALSVGSPFSRRLPAYCTSTGKVLLAYRGPEYVQNNLPEEIPSIAADSKGHISCEKFIEELALIKKQGFARSKGEREEFVYAIAVPLMDINGKVVAAMSVSGFVSRIDTNEDAIINDLQNASKEISKQLGHNSGYQAY